MSFKYCNTIKQRNPDPQIIRDVIQDLSCVVEKTFGETEIIQCGYEDLSGEVQRLECELACCQQTNLELEDEMLAMRQEMQALQFALGERVEIRKETNGQVVELKMDIEKLEAKFKQEEQEKNELVQCCEELSRKLEACCEELAIMESQNQSLQCSCKEQEVVYEQTMETIQEQKCECNGLQEALAKCCQRIDDLQAENCCLRDQVKSYMAQVENMLEDKKNYLSKQDVEAAKWLSAKKNYEAEIADLKEALTCLEKSKTDACKKLTEIIRAHHVEMNNLKNDGNRIQQMYDNERKQRELLENKLRDCEQRKRNGNFSNYGGANKSETPSNARLDNPNPNEGNNDTNKRNVNKADKSTQKSNNAPSENTANKEQVEIIESKKTEEIPVNKDHSFTNSNDRPPSRKKETMDSISPSNSSTSSSSSNSDSDSNSKKKETDSNSNLLSKSNEKIFLLEEKLQQTKELLKEKTVSLELTVKNLENAREIQNGLALQMSQQRNANEELKRSLSIWKSKYAELEEKKISRENLESASCQTLSSLSDNGSSLYDEKIAEAEAEVQKLHALFLQAQDNVCKAENARAQAENECTTLRTKNYELKSQLKTQLSHLNSYTQQLAHKKGELEEKNEKITNLCEVLSETEKKVERLTNELKNSFNSMTSNENMTSELQAKIATLESENARLSTMREELDARLQILEPTLLQSNDITSALEERVASLLAENNSLENELTEERLRKDLLERELIDAQGLWEAEVKAKGILAEKIAALEKERRTAEQKIRENENDIFSLKEKSRQYKLELKVERELTSSLINKVDRIKETAKKFKQELNSLTNTPECQLLLEQLDKQKSVFEDKTREILAQKEALEAQLETLTSENHTLVAAINRADEELKVSSAERSTLKNLVKTKDRLELELVSLKRAIEENFVDKVEIERLKSNYEEKYTSLKIQYEENLSKKFLEVNTYLDKMTQERSTVDQIRNSNEDSLRAQLNSMAESMSKEIQGFKILIQEREQEIKSLRKTLDLVKSKYMIAGSSSNSNNNV